MKVSTETATVYRGGGRRYFTLRAACEAEARTIIQRKYPSEAAEYEDGQCYFHGSHWRELPHADKMLRRITRLVRANFNQSPGSHP